MPRRKNLVFAQCMETLGCFTQQVKKTRSQNRQLCLDRDAFKRDLKREYGRLMRYMPQSLKEQLETLNSNVDCGNKILMELEKQQRVLKKHVQSPIFKYWCAFMSKDILEIVKMYHENHSM